MNKDILGYLAGWYQSASAALLASAIIMPEARVESLMGAIICVVLGLLMVFLKAKQS